MRRFLKGVMIAVLAVAVLYAGTAFGDHRPANIVVMGGTLSLTGRYAEPASRYYNARKLYVNELNARGGLLGHSVELRILDDKSDKRTAIELYEKLITQDKLDLVLGPYSSGITDAVANVMERYKQPFLAIASSKVIWQRGRKYVFNQLALAQDFQKGALHLAKQIGVKRIAIIGEGSLFPRQVSEGALKWAKKLDLKVVLLESYRKKQTDFADLLEKINARGAQAIFSNSYFADSVAQIRQLRKLNLNVKIFAGTIGPAVPKFVEELGSTAEYVLGFSNWEPKRVLGYPGMVEFIETYEKRYGEKPNYHAAMGYAAMQIMEAAVKHVGSFDPERVRDALASIRVETIEGTWKVDEQGLSNREGLTFQIQNGQRVIVWPAHMSEARFLPMPRWEERAKEDALRKD
jgi:branched-chain amino acid transport system substrate-binding protein